VACHVSSIRNPAPCDLVTSFITDSRSTAGSSASGTNCGEWETAEWTIFGHMLFVEDVGGQTRNSNVFDNLDSCRLAGQLSTARQFLFKYKYPNFGCARVVCVPLALLHVSTQEDEQQGAGLPGRRSRLEVCQEHL
jgi:hypothetical protein